MEFLAVETLVDTEVMVLGLLSLSWHPMISIKPNDKRGRAASLQANHALG